MGEKQIGFKVTDERLEEIGLAASRKGQTIAGWVRQIIYEKLDAEKKGEEN